MRLADLPDILFPKKCVFCGRALVAGSPLSICGGCEAQIPYFQGEYLYVNAGRDAPGATHVGVGRDAPGTPHVGVGRDAPGTPHVGVGRDAPGAPPDGNAGGSAPACDRIVCALKYEGAVRRAVSGYKFYGRRDYGMTLAALLCERLERAEDVRSFDFITCVPLSRGRLRERGYNQAAVLAGYTAQYFGVPFEGGVLARGENALRQSTLRRGERFANARAAYIINKETPRERLAGARIILVDDVATSMSTVNACASALKAHGASEVVGAVVAARVYTPT